MEYAWIIYTSVTFAERVKRECRQKLKHCSVRQTPSSISQSGCSYGVRCYIKDLPVIFDISHELQLKIKGVYVEEKNQAGEVIYNEYDLS